MAGKRKNLVGERFGRLMVLAKAGRYKSDRHSQWECVCLCGKKINVPTNSLTMGRTKSCGCLYQDGTNDRTRMMAAWAARQKTVKKYRFQEEDKTLPEWAVALGISRNGLIYRMKHQLKGQFQQVS